MRNLFVKYTGGCSSRAGTSFAGFSKQTGRDFPPRLINFQFSLEQGLALEFGDEYMRVLSNGAYVTDTPLPIQAITQGNPANVTLGPTSTATAATSNVGAVTATYAPNDKVTLAGGVFEAPAVLQVTNTQLLSLEVSDPGIGNFDSGDTIDLNGGTQSTPCQAVVVTTRVVSATIAAAGAGGTPGTQTVTGTTGVGTLFQANVIVDGAGTVTAVLGIVVPGSYTTNPTTPATEPVTGGGLAGAQLNVVLGVDTVFVNTAGVFTANPSGGLMTEIATSGSGSGATFKNAILGPLDVTVFDGGVYTTTPANPVSQDSSTGGGVGATFTLTFGPGSASFANGDWINITGVVGMTELNGLTFVIGNVAGTSFDLFDVYGNPIDSTAFTAYVSGGEAARIFTKVSPYAEEDLAWLKFTQSADVMSICCRNQDSGFTYPPYDLTRHSDTNWDFNIVVPAPTIAPPATLTATASSGGSTNYIYVVTAVNPKDGTESLPSPLAYVDNAVNIAATAGTISLSWASVAPATTYNVYKAPVAFGTRPPNTGPFGYIGTCQGTTFVDSNSVPDFTQQPPVFSNPFDAFNNYPSTVAYFQQRRIYANTRNQPDTYFMSQTGAFTNFDVRNPTIDSDAITGSPWSVQVDGIQFMVPRPGGLIVLTGREAWQLTGPGGSSLSPQAITPGGQNAQPQAFNGCHNHVPPLGISEELLYLQSKGAIVRALAYQIYANVYTGADITVNSSHLFTGYSIEQWAWCEEPYKTVWAVRTDGTLLSLVYVKAEQIVGWSRHDTNGQFVSCCAVTEPPVDALYVAVKRTLGAHEAYTVERMDNRLWATIDDVWAVDCGLSLPQTKPAASLMLSSADGNGALTGVTNLVGGSGYSAGTLFTVVDDNGQGGGSGALVVPTIVGGVVTAIAFSPAGSGYVRPRVDAYDPAGSEGGSGFNCTPTLATIATATASTGVFASGDVGSVIRAIGSGITTGGGALAPGTGGIATITQFNSATEVLVEITQPFTNVVPDSDGTVASIPADSWTMTAPVSTVRGLNHLIGCTVTGLADGTVITPRVVNAQGEITLDASATSVVVGLGFEVQFQSLYLDTQSSPTTQGQRKKVAAVTARIESSRGFEIGANQPDGATLSPIQIAPQWRNLTAAPDQGEPAYGSTVVPLWTGDQRIPLPGGYNTKGQIALQQRNPLPLNLLSLIAEDDAGDLPQVRAPKQGSRASMADQ